MKFRGKIDWWVWAILAIVNGGLLAGMGAFLLEGTQVAGAVVDGVILALVDAFLLPMVARNYVLLEEEGLKATLGMLQVELRYEEIRSAEPSRSPLASMALSRDRIYIQSKGGDLLVAVREKERFLQELRKRMPPGELR